ncbi:SDR family NAD(P)-dependent oxidoreductase [Georgenia yuyongxinii]|nr:SDR family NAD(P)-dependent oxidoreductase [Georgenia yuyongxinii]
MNALGQPGTVVVVGGTSEIARAILTRVLLSRPCDVVLAGRPGPRLDQAVRGLRALDARVQPVHVDATDVDHLVGALRAALVGREVDVALIAHGVLPDQDALERDPVAAGRLVTVNTAAAVAVGTLLAGLMRRQGHGVIVAMSSIAGVRPRASNYAYGATKAGLDSFFTGLGARLRGTGVHVVVVRPGFVRTRMTAGLDPAPFAVGSDDVARAVLAGLDRDVVWVPRALGPVMAVLRLAPRPLWRRLDQGPSQRLLRRTLAPWVTRPRRPQTSTRGGPR